MSTDDQRGIQTAAIQPNQKKRKRRKRKGPSLNGPMTSNGGRGMRGIVREKPGWEVAQEGGNMNKTPAHSQQLKESLNREKNWERPKSSGKACKEEGKTKEVGKKGSAAVGGKK